MSSEIVIYWNVLLPARSRRRRRRRRRPPPPPPPPPENMTAAILSYAVSDLHEGTGKLRKICADTVGHFTESVDSF